MRLFRYILVASGLAFGCSSDQQSGVDVSICGDLEVPAEIDGVRLTVFTEDRREVFAALVDLSGGALSEPDMGADGGVTFPDSQVPEDATVTPPPNVGWFGGPCETKEECGHSEAQCLTGLEGFPGGLCTKTCTNICPNRNATPSVFCVDNLGGGDGGNCVQECDVERMPPTGCRRGFECGSKSKFGDSETVRDVCLPESFWSDPAPAPDAEVVADGGPMDAGLYEIADAATDLPTRTYARERVPSATRGWIRAQGLQNGVVRVTTEVRPGSGALLGLSRACLGVRCEVGQTCIGGQCDSVPLNGSCP